MPDRCTKRYREIVDHVATMIRARTDGPVRIAEICRDAGVSSRQLLRAFQAVHRMTPHRYLQAMRLSGARQALLHANGDSTTVTEVAMQFGFVELGRFAAAYRATFGETPSATLRRPAMTNSLPDEDPRQTCEYQDGSAAETSPAAAMGHCARG